MMQQCPEVGGWGGEAELGVLAWRIKSALDELWPQCVSLHVAEPQCWSWAAAGDSNGAQRRAHRCLPHLPVLMPSCPVCLGTTAWCP